MRIIQTIAAICLSLAIGHPSLAEEPARDYQLVWSDEFNEDGPPSADNWGYERGFERNEELQWYRPENARCENGLLVIEARREQLENPRYDRARGDSWRNRPHAAYTSASLHTRGRHQWRYGRFEMRGRIDTRAGIWPAWWTLGTERGWPAGGEIDMMEYYRGQLLANVAWRGRRRWEVRWDESKRPLAEFGDPDWSEKFHVWRMEWDAQQIQLFIDDKLLNTTDLTQTENGDRKAANPFHEQHYMLLSLAVGGTRGGDPSGTEFPARFEVDYVRVYQKRGNSGALPQPPGDEPRGR